MAARAFMQSIGRPTAVLVAAGAATSLAAALRPVAGAFLAVPAAAGAAAAAIGTVKIATFGLSDAMEALAEGDAADVKEAMKGLPPAARKTARALDQVRQQFVAVRKTVQQTALSGLAGPLKRLGSTLLPTLQTGLSGVARSLNTLAKRAIAVGGTPLVSGALSKVMSTTAASLRAFAPAVGPVVRALAAMAKVGLPAVRGIAEATARVAEQKAAWLASAEGVAWMQRKLAEAKVAIKDLIAIGTNLKNALQGIFRASGAEGLLKMLRRLTKSFSEFINSAEGQRALQRMLPTFTQLEDTLRATAIIVSQVAQVLGRLVQIFLALPEPVQKNLARFIAWGLVIGKLDSILRPFIGILFKLGKGLVRLGGKAAPLLIAGLKRLGPVLAKIPMLLRAIGVAMRFMLGPWGLAIGLAVTLAVVVIKNWGKIKNFVVNAAKAIWRVVKSVFSRISSFVRTAVTMWRAIIMNVWNRIVSIVTGAAQAVWNAVRSAFGRVVGFMRSIPGRILSALGNLGSLLVGAGRALISGLWNGIKSMFGWLKDRVTGLGSRVKGWFESQLGIGSPSRVMMTVGEQVGEGLARGMDAEQARVAAASRKLAHAATVRPGQTRGGDGAAMAAGAGSVAAARGGGSGRQVIEIRVEGPEEVKKLIRTITRKDGGGSVQQAFGSSR